METFLLSRIARGEEAAVPECVSKYGGLIWSLAKRRLRSQQDAEDAVQEIFIDIWRSAGRFDPLVADEVTFVAMIARRRLIDRMRRQKNQSNTCSLHELSVVEAVSVQRFSEGVVALELWDEARVAAEHLQELHPEEQRVLRLSVYDGLSHAAIAEQTLLPLGTVKSHIRRGLHSLRQKLSRRSSVATRDSSIRSNAKTGAS
ncbi:MAG: sigma-70 family RNA polymerase sigma factor [Planctomycetota bacterium]|nr:MAG: sigma-70 family RNA polymerase sigma factor [Planctomycetota bacterium]